MASYRSTDNPTSVVVFSTYWNCGDSGFLPENWDSMPSVDLPRKVLFSYMMNIIVLFVLLLLILASVSSVMVQKENHRHQKAIPWCSFWHNRFGYILYPFVLKEKLLKLHICYNLYENSNWFNWLHLVLLFHLLTLRLLLHLNGIGNKTKEYFTLLCDKIRLHMPKSGHINRKKV